MTIHDEILASLKELIECKEEVSEFCSLPLSISRQEMSPKHRAASDALQSETKLCSVAFAEFQEKLIAAGPEMHWREVYRKDDNTPVGISMDFMERLGVYAIIGETGPFLSKDISVYLVYMPANLTYPWHYHPAEELYFILSGEGMFRRQGYEDRLVSEGDIIIHGSNQPHEMQTYDSPLLSLAIWRNHLDIPPTLVGRP